MATPQAKFEITADDKTSAALKSAIRNVEDFSSSLKKTAQYAAAGFSLAALKDGISNAIELGDEMGKLADRTGLTANAASELSRVFQQNELDNEKLATSMQKMQVALSKNDSIFKEIGLSVSALKAESADQAFEDIAEAIKNIPDPADRARAAVEIFGKSGAELLPLMLQGKEGIQQLRKELGGLSDGDVAALQQADDAIKKLSFLQQSFWNNVAVGIVTVGESLGLLDKPARIEYSNQLNKLLDQRIGILQQIRELEENKGGQPATVRNKAIEIQQKNLSLVQAKIDAVNTSLLALDVQNNVAKSSQSDFSESLVTTATGLSEVTISAAKTTTAYERLIERQIDAHKASIAFYDDIAAQRGKADDYWRSLSESASDYANKIEVQVPASVKKAAEESSAFAQELNRSMTSAFSDMFYNLGTGASSFADDMINALRRVLANAATQQLFEYLTQLGSTLQTSGSTGSANGGGNWFSSAVGSALTSMFGGFRAEGGGVSAGSAYVVGEQGPEIFMPGSSGSIVPNHALGGSTTINHSPVYNINGSGLNQAQLVAAMNQASEQSVARVMEMKRRGQL